MAAIEPVNAVTRQSAESRAAGATPGGCCSRTDPGAVSSATLCPMRRPCTTGRPLALWTPSGRWKLSGCALGDAAPAFPFGDVDVAPGALWLAVPDGAGDGVGVMVGVGVGVGLGVGLDPGFGEPLKWPVPTVTKNGTAAPAESSGPAAVTWTW